MASQKVHPLQDIHITADEKPFKVIETIYKFNEKTGKFDPWKTESRKTTTYYAVLWRNFVFVREAGKHEYEALCGRSVKKRFGVDSDMEGWENEVVGYSFHRKLQVEDKYLVIPSRINGIPVTNVKIDNCKSSYMICPPNIDTVLLFACEYLKKIIGGNFKSCYIAGKNKLQDLRFMRNEGYITSRTWQNGLKEIIISCEDSFDGDSYGFDCYPMLLDVYSLENTPPEALNLFQYDDNKRNLDNCLGNTLKHGILHVPQGSKRYYKVAYGWKNFQNIEEFTQEEIDEKLAEYEREDERILNEAYDKLKDELFPQKRTSQPKSQTDTNKQEEERKKRIRDYFADSLNIQTDSSQSESREHHFQIPDCFERKGDVDLLYKLQLDDNLKLYGGKVIVPTLTGQIRITVPAGKSTGDSLRVRGKGLTGPNINEVGDLYIEII